MLLFLNTFVIVLEVRGKFGQNRLTSLEGNVEEGPIKFTYGIIREKCATFGLNPIISLKRGR